MKDIKQIIARARFDIIVDQPFFGSLLLALTAVESQNTQTFRTDGELLEYNPDYVAKLKPKEVRTIICECILHAALGHIYRLESRDPQRFNLACDYAVANILRDSNECAAKDKESQLRDYFDLAGELKNWCPKNPTFDNLSAEEIYNLIPPAPKSKRPPPPQLMPGGTPGSQPGKQPGSGEPGDQPPPPATSSGEVAPAKGDKAQREESEGQWKVRVVQAATAAKSMATLPEMIKRMVDDIVAPTVPWRDQLRHFFNVRQRDDFSWRRPKNSMIHRGIYLPSLDSVRMGTIVVAVDTSGSVNDDILRAFQSEVQAVVDECAPEQLIVMYCDAEVNLVREYTAGDLIDLKAVGGGGTDFRPVFRYIDTDGIEPCCLIYLTDLMGQFPKEEPLYPVLWGSVTKDHSAPFGDTIYVTI